MLASNPRFGFLLVNTKTGLSIEYTDLSCAILVSAKAAGKMRADP